MKPPTTPAKVLFAFTFFSTFLATIYAAWEINPPVLIEVLTPIVFAWLFWWWLIQDSKTSGLRWPMTDLGFFVYFAWFVILPYHLLKTRGLKGSLAVLAFFGVYFAGWLTAVLLIYFTWRR
jgi:hypothetical protein